MKETILILSTRAIYTCAVDDLSLFSNASNATPHSNSATNPPSPSLPLTSVPPSLKKIRLENITSLQYGVYITSTFTASSIDEDRNVGFLIRFHDDVDVQNKTVGKMESMAFKYLSRSSFVSGSVESSSSRLGLPSEQDPARKERSPLEFVEGVCQEIQSAAADGIAGAAATNNNTNSSGSHPVNDHDDASSSTKRNRDPEEERSSKDSDRDTTSSVSAPLTPTPSRPKENAKEEKQEDKEEREEGKGIEMIKKDLVSVASARRGTGLVEWGVYRVKRYIWAS